MSLFSFLFYTFFFFLAALQEINIKKGAVRLQFELLQGTCGYVNLFPHAIRRQQSHAEFSQADFFFFFTGRT